MSAAILHLGGWQRRRQALAEALGFIGNLPLQTDAGLRATLDAAKRTAEWLRGNGYNLLGVDGATRDGQPILRIEAPGPGSYLAEKAWMESSAAGAEADYCGTTLAGCWIYWTGISGDAEARS